MNKINVLGYSAGLLILMYIYVPAYCMVCFLPHSEYPYFRQCNKQSLMDISPLYPCPSSYLNDNSEDEDDNDEYGYIIVDTILSFLSSNDYCFNCNEMITNFRKLMDTCVTCNVIFCSDCWDKQSLIRKTPDGMFIYLFYFVKQMLYIFIVYRSKFENGF